MPNPSHSDLEALPAPNLDGYRCYWLGSVVNLNGMIASFFLFIFTDSNFDSLPVSVSVV